MTEPALQDFVVDVAPAEFSRVTEILALAFRTDPGFQVSAGSSGRQREARIRAMVASTLDVHVACGNSVQGIYREGKLLAVSLAERPGAKFRMWPSLRSSMRLMIETNPIVAARSSRAFLTVMRRRPHRPHHYLSMLAVDPIVQGCGMGGTLLTDLCESCRQHRMSEGVALDTSNPANVAYYERFGFDVVSTLRVGGIDVWCMWQPCSGND